MASHYSIMSQAIQEEIWNKLQYLYFMYCYKKHGLKKSCGGEGQRISDGHCLSKIQIFLLLKCGYQSVIHNSFIKFVKSVTKICLK